MDSPGPITPEPPFENALNQVVCAGLAGGVTFATMVGLLEASKSDVLELWKAQMRQSPPTEEPLIVPFRGVPPKPNGE